MMHKILFICHGNICRSPMAESVMTHLVTQAKRNHEFVIDSAAVSREEIGNGVHYGTREILRKYNIPCIDHHARQLTKEDAEYFDLILCMDLSNIRYAQRLVPLKHHHKIRTLLNRNIADPWYTGNFEETYRDVLSGCTQLLEKL
jgi:protein-tyrosine phosphatase